MLKIADYGISQVSIGLTLNTQSTGTPGYMAPEHLKAAKGTISSDKVSAYSCVLCVVVCEVLDKNKQSACWKILGWPNNEKKEGFIVYIASWFYSMLIRFYNVRPVSC